MSVRWSPIVQQLRALAVQAAPLAVATVREAVQKKLAKRKAARAKKRAGRAA